MPIKILQILWTYVIIIANEFSNIDTLITGEASFLNSINNMSVFFFFFFFAMHHDANRK